MLVTILFDQMLASSSAQQEDTVEDTPTPDSPLDASCDEVEDSDVEDDYDSQPGSRLLHASKAHTSPVWKYYIARRTYSLCKLCRRTLKRSSGSTTSMLHHLKSWHRKEYVAVMKEKRRRKEAAAAAEEEVCEPLLLSLLL